jgi:hypothetical protein
MFKHLWLLHFLISFGIALLIAVLMGQHQASSFAIGASLVSLNLFSHYFAWNLIFKKKFIALGVVIIVFKYAFLGLIVYLLSLISWIVPAYVALGLATLSIAAIFFGKLFDKE